MEIFVDKIENNIAELHFENEEIIHIDINSLPKGLKEGDYLTIKFNLNNLKRNEVENSVEKLINELSNNSEGGDFEI